MSEKDKRLCEKCHERPATCHICDASTGKSQDLCEACFQESALPEVLAGSNELKETIRNGKCKYCGQPATGGSGDTDPLGKRFNLYCKQCSLDLAEFYQMPENDLPIDFSFDDPKKMKQRLQQHRELERRLKEFIKQRISKRKSKGNG